MSKTPGQISSTTLSLRFMQNAAKAKQEREVEAAKAKIRTEEEWEIGPDLRESWGAVQTETEDQSVSYEQSYLPFLFPGLSKGQYVANTENGEEEENDISGSEIRERRVFGKNGKEETGASTVPPPPPPSVQIACNDGLPRGIRTISSHGRNVASSSKSSGRVPERPAPPISPSTVARTSIQDTSRQGFIKPQVEAPAIGARRKRPAGAEEVEVIGTDSKGGENGGKRIKKKKRKEDT